MEREKLASGAEETVYIKMCSPLTPCDQVAGNERSQLARFSKSWQCSSTHPKFLRLIEQKERRDVMN